MFDWSKLTPLELERVIYLQGLEWRQNAAIERTKALREYYSGDHPVLLTQRQQEFIGDLVKDGTFPFSHNLCRTVIDTLRERLDVTGITINGAGVEDVDTDRADPNAALAVEVWKWWRASRMDSGQIELYRSALRDGSAYIMVDFDTIKGMPRFTVHTMDDGAAGVAYHRDPERPSDPLFASRFFRTFDPLRPGETGTARRTVYLQHEIRKYKRGGTSTTWQQVQDAGDLAWPLPWNDWRGQPLGVPVFEFGVPGDSEIDQIIGLQNALNKTWLDLIAAADASGFPILAVEYNGQLLGPSGDDDDLTGADEFRVAPARAIEVGDARIHRIEAANLTPLMDVAWSLTAAIAGVSRTPQYYLRPVGGSEVPSGEALKQLESGLVKRAEERQRSFGQSWADAIGMAIRIARTYGSLPASEEEIAIDVTWADPNTRNEFAMAQVAQAQKSLGVPDEQIWSLLGYSAEQISAFHDSVRQSRAADVAAIAASLRTQQIGQPQQVAAQPVPSRNGASNE